MCLEFKGIFKYVDQFFVVCYFGFVWCFKVVKIFEVENDRLKLIVLYCGDEDELVVRVVIGVLVMLIYSEKICRKVLEVIYVL